MATSSSAADPTHKKDLLTCNGVETTNKSSRAIVEHSSDPENQVLKFIAEHNART